jgi:predicted acylesterase/phospholipase RssA
VRGIDVISALSAVGGLPSLVRTLTACAEDAISRLRSLRVFLARQRESSPDGQGTPPLRRGGTLPGPGQSIRSVGRDSSWRRPLRRSILLLGFVCLFALQGCADITRHDSRGSDGRLMPQDGSMAIRTLGADHRFAELSSAAIAEQIRELHVDEPLNILALSSGGANGAFGAGALAGLTRSGSRPEFAVVTGVSVGALVAPYAFLGSTWDARLREAYTSGAGEHLLQPRVLGALFGSSVYRGAPLSHLIDTYLSDEMILAIASETAKGRLLLVATTDVGTGRPVVWDLGSIARNGGPHARALVRDVLVASASVPVLFPPVMLRVGEEGATHDEAHVDGAATVPFFVPPAFVQAPAERSAGTRRTAIYVIIDGPLDEAVGATRLTAQAILQRSIHAGMNQMMLTTLELMAANAELQGSTLEVSAIPAGYPHQRFLDMRADTMGTLFRYAYQCAEAGRLWTAFRRTGDDPGTLGGSAGTQSVPCPADDRFIEYVARR